MLKDNVPNHKDRKPLFPGGRFGELSSDGPNDQVSTNKRRNSQLNVIFDILGTPSDIELMKISEDSKDLIMDLNRKTRAGFVAHFPGSTPEEIDLLTMMLKFSDTDRITIDEALKHPYFRDARKPELEIDCPTPMSNAIESIEEDDNHLYDSVVHEVLLYHERAREISLSRSASLDGSP